MLGSRLNKFPRVKLLHAIVRGSSILVMTMLIRQHVPTLGQRRNCTMNVFLHQRTAFAVQLALARLAVQRWDLSFFCAGVEDGREFALLLLGFASQSINNLKIRWDRSLLLRDLEAKGGLCTSRVTPEASHKAPWRRPGMIARQDQGR